MPVVSIYGQPLAAQRDHLSIYTTYPIVNFQPQLRIYYTCTSITQLEKRLGDLKATPDGVKVSSNAQQLNGKLESLDVKFNMSLHLKLLT